MTEAQTLESGRVYLRSDLKQPALLRFVETSALHYCTTVERHPNGGAMITSRWDPAGFSTGERVLWRVLGSLADGDLAEAFDRLDVSSLRALCGVFSFYADVVA